MENIPYVTPADFGRLEGETAGMGWIVAQDRFQSTFDQPYEYCKPWDTVLKHHGCFQQNDAVTWAAGMNQIIAVLNRLPEKCSREQLQAAFSL